MAKPKRSLENAGISDNAYLAIMQRVANDNYKNWELPNSDAALVHALNDNTYNYRGYYNKYPNGKGNAIDHWTDEFKTVYHPTFSKESKYSGKKSQYNPKGITGGTWYGEYFLPSIDQYVERNKFRSARIKRPIGGPSYNTTGGAGYVPSNYGSQLSNLGKKVRNKVVNYVRQTIYDRVDPISYNVPHAISQLLYKGRDTGKDDVYNALWARYLGRTNTQAGQNVDEYLQPADYTLTKGKPVGKVYKLTSKAWSNYDDMNPLGDIQLYKLIKSGKKSKLISGEGDTKTGLGDYTVSLGEDANGKYMSYYDEWDIAPLGHKAGKEGKDQTLGIGTPFSVYDRRYYTDDEIQHIVREYDKMYKSISDATKNQSVKHDIYTPKPYKKRNGGIHIAPSKRGTFTTAATKHGMSVQGFASRVLANKENYSPAMVKKANFAKNASKWNH